MDRLTGLGLGGLQLPWHRLWSGRHANGVHTRARRRWHWRRGSTSATARRTSVTASGPVWISRRSWTGCRWACATRARHTRRTLQRLRRAGHHPRVLPGVNGAHGADGTDGAHGTDGADLGGKAWTPCWPRHRVCRTRSSRAPSRHGRRRPAPPRRPGAGPHVRAPRGTRRPPGDGPRPGGRPPVRRAPRSCTRRRATPARPWPRTRVPPTCARSRAPWTRPRPPSPSRTTGSSPSSPRRARAYPRPRRC
ncbi:hypothetical protein SGLAM104S_02341 [Streptomyces glaucescens]